MPTLREMRLEWPGFGLSGLRFIPAAAGVGLVAVGVSLLIWPELFRYTVAGAFIFAGFGLLGFARRMGRGVTYRRIDPRWPGGGSDLEA